MSALLASAVSVFAGVSFLALLLTRLGKLGIPGKQMMAYFSQAPGLDVILSVLIWIPWLVTGLMGGIWGIVGAILGQVLAVQTWMFLHETLHRQVRPDPGIQSYLNQRYGWWRNHLALWATAIVIPVFFLLRGAQIFVYPCLVWILDFRTYNHREWINVSRQKFTGLIGADLIWCLYCDWMTGVYSLGAEMLRNVESFWCPIRFYNDKKCENCKIDFPDIEGGWVAADGQVSEVVKTLESQIPGEQPWSWFGDPDRQSSSETESEIH